MSVESQMEELGKKLALELIPLALAGTGIPAPITRIVLEALIGALQEEQNNSDAQLRRLVGSYYKDGVELLTDAKYAEQVETRNDTIKQALDRFVTASNVEDALLKAKSQFFVGVCYDLQNERNLAKRWYEKASLAAAPLADQLQGRPQQLEQLEQFVNSLSQVLRAHGSKLSISQSITRGNQSGQAITGQKTQMEWLDKGNFTFKFTLGITDLQHQRYEEALAAFEYLLCLRLDPNFAASVYASKGAALIGLKRDQEALEACELALHLYPNFAEAYNNKGTALIGLKRYEEALTACEQALRLKPNLKEARANKSYVLKLLERLYP